MTKATESIHLQASDFAERISSIARIFSGDRTHNYKSDIISGERGWSVEIHNDRRGFTLRADEKETFLVQANWTCSSDRTGQWLKVERSSFGVFLSERPSRPLFRYDFDDRNAKRLPKAHIHFQADHPDMSSNQAMMDTQESLGRLGMGSRRARNRVNHEKQTQVSDLHFPVGGTRFRPALEDILLMMLEEYGVEPDSMDPVQAVEKLRESLSGWRLSQAKAVVRDMPLLAIDFFESAGFRVIPDHDSKDPTLDPRHHFSNRTEKLTAP